MVNSTYASGYRSSGSKTLHGTEYVDGDLIYNWGNIRICTGCQISHNG